MKQNTLIIAAVLALGATTVASAQTVYHVAVNTGPSTATGGIDFQFNPADPSAGLGAVTISNFTFDNPGALTPSPSIVGNAVGLLPGPVTLTNSAAINDYFESFTFGNTISFDATFTGAALTPPVGGTFGSGSTFAFSLFDQSNNPQLTTDPNGTIADITVNPDGTFGTQTFSSPGNFGNLATITLISSVPPPPAVPEASTTVSFGLLLALGLGGMAIARKRKTASKSA